MTARIAPKGGVNRCRPKAPIRKERRRNALARLFASRVRLCCDIQHSRLFAAREG
jgi:hypothetical protein